MDLGGPALAHDRRVPRRDVADVRAETELRIERIGAPHIPVADHFRDDRGGGNRRALLVPVDDGSVLGRVRPEAESVYETDLGRRGEFRENAAKAGQVRAMKAELVDLAR